MLHTTVSHCMVHIVESCFTVWNVVHTVLSCHTYYIVGLVDGNYCSSGNLYTFITLNQQQLQKNATIGPWQENIYIYIYYIIYIYICTTYSIT